MTKLNAKQFVKYLENMGFFVRNTTVMNGVDDHATLADSFTATIDTENGLFEMTVTDYMILASKPNGTQKYWDNLTDARARSYVRQVLDFNKPLPKPEPEVEEAPQAEAEAPEPEAPRTVRNEALGETTTARPVEGMTLDWWQDGETHTAPAWRGENHRYFVMVDGTLYGVRDAFVDGTLRPVLAGAWEEVNGVEEAKEALKATWDELAEEEGVEVVAASLQDLLDGYRTDPEDDLDACPEAAEAMGIDPYDPTDDQLAAWAEADLTAAREWLDGHRDPEFAELTPEQEEELETLNVGRAVITEEQAGRVRDALRLDGMGAEALTRVRNAAVRHLAGLMGAAREAGDWEWFDQLQANMSGVCAVIDCRLMRVA